MIVQSEICRWMLDGGQREEEEERKVREERELFGLLFV